MQITSRTVDQSGKVLESSCFNKKLINKQGVNSCLSRILKETKNNPDSHTTTITISYR